MILGDFVEQLTARLQEQGVPMPFENEGPWHELFYTLKQADVSGKPEFLRSLRFDWDGPYPKSQELSEFLHALHWNACIDARNPHFDKITLPPDIAAVWARDTDRLGIEEKSFLSHAAAQAKAHFADPETVMA